MPDFDHDDEERAEPRLPSTKYCVECGEKIRYKAVICPECGVKQPMDYDDDDDYLSRREREYAGSKTAAGVCAIMLGSLGIHKFILGLTTPGLIMLLVTVLTCGIGGLAMHVIGLAEGIIYLSKSDEDFYRIYVKGKKGWF